jgi:uncharacterized beta-barrel protein YwiB (DUF1934 family)
MKKIMMKITGKQASDGDNDQMEFVTEGELYERNGALYLMYEETEISGMPGCKTRLKIKGDHVSMKRLATKTIPAGTEMEFAPGKVFTGPYDTPYGSFEMEIVTNRIFSDLTAEGTGRVDIDYKMSLKGLVESHNQLSIEIL